MNYLITTEVGEGVYWRHQLANLTFGQWQNIQLAHSADSLSAITAADRVVVIMSLNLLRHERFDDIESMFYGLRQQDACICWIVSEERLMQVPEVQTLSAKYGACIYVEGRDAVVQLEQMLYRPMGGGQQKPVGSNLDSQLEITQPLVGAKDDASRYAKSKDKTFWWRRSSPLKELPMRVRARGCMSVIGNSVVASELAVTAAANGIRTVLVDLDRFKPSLDFLFDTAAALPYGHQRLDQYHTTGLNVLLDSARFKQLDAVVVEKCCVKIKGHPLLRIVTGVYDLGEIEYFRSEDLEAIVHLLLNANDLVILAGSPFLYDGFTLKAMHLSKLILQVVSKDLSDLRGYNQQLKLLKEKQRIAYERHVWMTVGGECEPSALRAFSKLGLGTFVGNAALSQADVTCLMGGSAYFRKWHCGEEQNHYLSVLRRLSEEG